MVINCSHLGRNFFPIRFTVFACSFSFSLEVSNTPGKPLQEGISGMEWGYKKSKPRAGEAEGDLHITMLGTVFKSFLCYK